MSHCAMIIVSFGKNICFKTTKYLHEQTNLNFFLIILLRHCAAVMCSFTLRYDLPLLRFYETAELKNYRVATHTERLYPTTK